jgi:hypothetical protein
MGSAFGSAFGDRDRVRAHGMDDESEE